MIRIKKILYPTDFSSYSNQAYFHAVSLAEKHGASLTVVFVYSPDMVTPGDPSDPRAYWRDQLEQIRPVDTRIPVRHVLLEGNAAAEIVRFGREHNIDLIVVGTHGRTGVDRPKMGSVAEQILREAACSVLVVKLPRGRQSASRSDAELAVPTA
jgi:nucleotide-binding universal stress UspA family protein